MCTVPRASLHAPASPRRASGDRRRRPDGARGPRQPPHGVPLVPPRARLPRSLAATSPFPAADPTRARSRRARSAPGRARRAGRHRGAAADPGEHRPPYNGERPPHGARRAHADGVATSAARCDPGPEGPHVDPARNSARRPAEAPLSADPGPRTATWISAELGGIRSASETISRSAPPIRLDVVTCRTRRDCAPCAFTGGSTAQSVGASAATLRATTVPAAHVRPS